MSLILTVTLNAAVDKTYRVPHFEPGGIFHVEEQHTGAGGKGINVARIAHTLGAPVITTGFAGGHLGALIISLLESEGLNPQFVPITAESRLCIALVDPAQGVETKVNEQGPSITPAEADRFLEHLRRLAGGEMQDSGCGMQDAGYGMQLSHTPIPLSLRTSIPPHKFSSPTPPHSLTHAVLSGRLPPGLPDDFYLSCLRVLKRVGVWCAVDTSGMPLRQILENVHEEALRPDLLKPNAEELSEVLNEPIPDFEAAYHHSRAWVKQSISFLITFGARGALLTTPEGAWIAYSPEVQYISAVGSGDSALGAFVWALSQEEPFPDALRWAVGAGAANAATFGAALCGAESIRECAQKVRVNRFPT